MDIEVKKIDEVRFLIPKKGNMRVDGLVYATDELMEQIKKDQSLVQVANVATLPGIVLRSLAMPDIHWGYGFPIGGVAAFDMEEGIVSPGGVGYDINCGCRLMLTDLEAEEIRPRLKELVSALFKNIPCGVGSTGAIKLNKKELFQVATKGALWAVEKGFGERGDLIHTEDQGLLPNADPEVLSDKAIQRGSDQLGTLGSGNHFLEVGEVVDIYDQKVAERFGIKKGQLTVLIHSGSRGFGHQICDDFLKAMTKLTEFNLPDRQLACARIRSDLGRQYLSAMACAANYAWANRQILMHYTHETLLKTLNISPKALNFRLLYDVCHNIAKIERHTVQGKEIQLCVHRKGATRALPPKHPLLPEDFQDTGQPVLIPGDMGTESFVLVGATNALVESFASTCHGAGRVLSRSQAIKAAKGRAINRELEDQGIIVMSRGKETLKEEIPDAYKDVSQVVDVVQRALLATKVARLRPLGVIKG